MPAFAIEQHNVTNARFLEFVEAGGYRDARWWRPQDWQWVQSEHVEHPLFWERVDGGWYWRGMFDLVPLPLSWPVYVSHAEAAAYARWRGARLPTEAEYQRAAFGADGTSAVSHPWGAAEPDDAHGVFDFSSWDPQPAGSHPAGASAWGVDDLVGNGWEWTSTTFAPFPGFRPMASYPEYSADFFDGEHFVMKGASPATARELLRPTLPQLVSRALSVRLRDIQVRQMMIRTEPIAPPVAQFAADVHYYLNLAPRQLPSRYFYDELGSALFDAICALPWYGITRTRNAAARGARPIHPRRRYRA